MDMPADNPAPFVVGALAAVQEGSGLHPAQFAQAGQSAAQEPAAGSYHT